MGREPVTDYESSPRAWGCFQQLLIVDECHRVFPTCVGVFPWRTGSFCRPAGLPHVRGGVSAEPKQTKDGETSSPRAWGCFWHAMPTLSTPSVFPTCVGVFLASRCLRPPGSGLPHVRGGVSVKLAVIERGQWSSPRAWGCFNSTGAWEAMEAGLPHVRGGVSGRRGQQCAACPSSPRAWGCFRLTFSAL